MRSIKRAMNSFKIGNISIGMPNDAVFVIAEIGQNHQGNINIAKEMISKAKYAGADCVKFQKSCLEAKFTKTALKRLYNSPNSWGETYGEHKEYLEFSIDEYRELQAFASAIGILFTASAMDEVSLNDLLNLQVPFIKIGSGDANNFPLIEKASNQSIPIVISTGMQNMSTLDKIITIMDMNQKTNYCLMHCVSAYPTNPEDANLNLINLIKAKFPKAIIGYSGHEEGNLIALAAVVMGAKLIEKHFTLDKTQKGSDHSSSLNPTELKSLVESIRLIEEERITPLTKSEEILGFFLEKQFFKTPSDSNALNLALKHVNEKVILDCEDACRKKLGKSLVFARNLERGHVLSEKDLNVKVTEPFGISAEYISYYNKRKLKKSVKFDDSLKDEYLDSI